MNLENDDLCDLQKTIQKLIDHSLRQKNLNFSTPVLFQDCVIYISERIITEGRFPIVCHSIAGFERVGRMEEDPTMAAAAAVVAVTTKGKPREKCDKCRKVDVSNIECFVELCVRLRLSLDQLKLGQEYKSYIRLDQRSEGGTKRRVKLDEFFEENPGIPGEVGFLGGWSVAPNQEGRWFVVNTGRTGQGRVVYWISRGNGSQRDAMTSIVCRDTKFKHWALRSLRNQLFLSKSNEKQSYWQINFYCTKYKVRFILSLKVILAKVPQKIGPLQGGPFI
ncbi:hypothetical protein WN51_10775 [Melipona quadrifasciata]|uniref:Uncharacterized protein n=1 Tax=Melipona quadrifasciata TaxID=166423 RepID=A0A0M9A6L6_9HYME|nr:hypothetical protein WN51_10775 [Melipona quadrifasciata]